MMTITVKKAKSKKDYIRAWKEGMRHLHWFKESTLFNYNRDEMMQEIFGDFGETESAFFMAKLAKNEKVIGVLGIKLRKEVGMLRRWEPAIPLNDRWSGACEALVERGFRWLQQKRVQKAVCILRYQYSSPETADWHINLYRKCGFKLRGPVNVQLLADLSYAPIEKPVHIANFTITTSESYTSRDFAGFVLKTYSSTTEDRAIHGWDLFVSIPDKILNGLRSIKQGKHGLSSSEWWKITEAQGELAGFIVSFMPDDRCRPPYGVIGLIGVFPEFRRRGIAYTLISEMRKYFRAHGCYYAYVGTPKTNDKAINLYKKAGYRPIFELINFERQLQY